MPKSKKYWGVEKNVNRHGRPRWYYRAHKTAPRLRLPDTYGSPEFEAAWRAARAGAPIPLPVSPPGRAKARKASRGSLGWLIQLHLASAEFKALRPATQRPRRAMLEGLASAKGTTDIEDVTKSVIQASVDARRSTPHMANVWLGVVNGVFEWATRETLPDPLTGEAKPILEENPALGVKRVAIPKPAEPDEETGHPTFADEDLAKFEAAYSEGTLERRVYAVMLYTGFRVGDAARVGRQHVQKDGTIKIKTEKTGTEVEIDIVPPLKRALAAGPHGRPEVLNFLTTARGKAWDKNYLGWWFGDACRAIGLNRSAHGLRKAAARRYAERGATVPQLMALFGWRTPAMAIHYVQMAERKTMALAAQRGMDWDEIENGISPHPRLAPFQVGEQRSKD
jgi:integrase